MRVAMLAKSTPGTGVARYAAEITRHLRELDVDVALSTPDTSLRPVDEARVRRSGIDIRSFLETYPWNVELPPADVYHFSVQTFAIRLLRPRPPRPAVVTVHDLIPWMQWKRGQPGSYRHRVHWLFDALALLALRRADALIVPSQWTRSTVLSELRHAPARIRVIPNGVCHEQFRPRPVAPDLRQRYGLDAAFAHVLYVGSNEARKNLAPLLRAIAVLRPLGVRLIIAGRSFDPERHRALRALEAELELNGTVLWLDHVPDCDLPLLYNAAAVAVLPSLLEGFGLPLVEAMSCGTPCICARASSLPEVAGDAAFMVDAADASQLAAAIEAVLCDRTLRDRLRAAGLERSAAFSWTRAAKETKAVYEELART